MADYKIGQILTSTEDVEIEKALSGEKVIIPKGNKVIIGADKLAHHIRIGFTDKKDKDGYTIFDKDGVPKRGSTDSIEYMHAVWHKSNLKPDYTKLVLI